MTDFSGNPGLSEAEALLVETFGTPLLAFLCGADEHVIRERLERKCKLSEAAERVLTQDLVIIAQSVAARLASEPRYPRALALEFLGHVPPGQSQGLGTLLRESAGFPVSTELIDRAGGDEVKEHLSRLAIDAYPALIAPPDPDWPRISVSNYGHPSRPLLQAAIQADLSLQRLAPHDDSTLGRRGAFCSSLGRGTSYQDVMFGEMVVGSAWDSLTMLTDRPSLEDLVDQVHSNTDVLRVAASGGTAFVPARAVFTGFVTKDATPINTAWGSLRPLHLWEQRHSPAALEGAVTTTNPDGTQVTVRYAGEMVLETEVPYMLKMVDHIGEPLAKWPVATDALQRRFEGVQLAALLASDGEVGTWPTAKLAWTWIGDPLSHGSLLGWNDMNSGPGFTPLELDPDQCTTLGDWTYRVQEGWSPRMDIAARRMLSAANSRVDMADRLVDAVIVWENLFGTAQGEPRFRISAAMAWLLEADPEGRERLQDELKKLYDYRSRIVHGGETDPTQLADNANRALTLARNSLRVLFTDRSDVLKLSDGAARSLRLTMGG